MQDLKVVSIEDLTEMSKGEIVPIPSFVKGTMNVRLKKINTLNLFEKGILPNKLLSAAEELFFDKKSSVKVDAKDTMKVMEILAKETLVEPSTKQLEALGLELTDAQIISVFTYSQRGIEALIPSDSKSEDTKHFVNEQSIQDKA